MIHLKAKEGYKLVQSDTTIGIKDKVVCSELYAQDNQKDKWMEITIEEANAIEAEQERLRKEEDEKMKQEMGV